MTAAVCFCSGLSAQGPAGASQASDLQVPVASSQVRSSLARAANFLEQKQFSEAVDLLVRLIETSGGELIQRDAGSDSRELPWNVREAGWIPLRRRCQQMLCDMIARSPQGRAVYRQRVDALARQWLAQSLRDQSDVLLRRIVNELLASDVGDDALYLLGEMAWQNNHPALARSYWERMSPQLTVPADAALPMGSPLWPMAERLTTDSEWSEFAAKLAASQPAGRAICSDTNIPLAEIRARLVLASLLEGHVQRAQAELVFLERLHSGATGVIGGRKVELSKFLRDTLNSGGFNPAPLTGVGWPMIGQRPSRDGRAPHAIEIDNVAWRVSVERLEAPLERLFKNYRRPAQSRALLPYHVAVQDDIAAIVEPYRIRLLNAANGKPRFGSGSGEVWRAETWQRQLPVHPTVPHAGVAQFSSVIEQGRLLARLGPTITTSANPDNIRGSELVAMDLSQQARLLPSFPIVCQGDDPDDATGWSFEHAPPLSDRGRLYALARWNDGVRTSLSIDCYDMATGDRLWRTRLCGGRTWAQLTQSPDDPVWDELTNEQLTLADGMLYACTSMGVVCAVDSRTGQRLWTTPYPRAIHDPRRRHGHASRTTPCLATGRWLVCAPQDTGSLLALDRFDGRLLWTTDAELTDDVVHLLGAEHETLVVSGDRLQWISLVDGRVTCRFPESGVSGVSRSGPRPRGAGRGLIAGDRILWPTATDIYQFSLHPVLHDNRWTPLAHGAPYDLRRRNITGGNLSLGSDVLVIAGAKEVVGVEVRSDE